MKKPTVKKKIASRIPHALEARIVELSLQHPEFGAKRLLPLLNSDDIDVSASTVYNILKRNNLQTREKRLAKLAERSRKKRTPVAKKKPPRITNEAAERIMQVSLQNPDYGARRLVPLLEKDGIQLTASAVYRILKRHGLQNRQKRLAKIKERQAVETLRPQAEKPQPVPQVYAEKVRPSPVRSGSRAHSKTRVRRSWALTLSNMLLLALLAYLGLHTVQNVRTAMQEPQAVASAVPQPIDFAGDANKIAAATRLNDYRIIWQRNLFNISKQEAPAPEKEIAVEKVALAKKDLGLKLVGTAVADDPMLRRAFIDNRSTRKQEAYREGDTAGGARIKKILRNKVVIATKEGDRLLVADMGEASKSSKPSTSAQQTSASQVYPQQVAERRHPGRSITLARQEVEASLANIDELEQQLNIEPYLKDDRPSGFTISRIPSESILRKMGIKNGTAIMGLNDEAITGPEQAGDFFQTVAAGGEMTIKARIGRGVRRRTRWFRLNIE